MSTIQIQLDSSISVPLAPRLARLGAKVAFDEAGIARLLIAEFALHATPTVEEWILARARNERELPNLWETVSAAARLARTNELLPELKLAEAVAAVARHKRYQ